ncbi:hypothetical protein AB0K48_19615, partial [Nonomuraea sp. NPDC055795]
MPRTPEDFGAAFTQLLKAAGLNVDGVLKHRPDVVARSTLFSWMKGDHLPNGIAPLRSVVELCLARTGGSADELGTAPDNVEGWLVLLGEAKQSRDSRGAQTRTASPLTIPERADPQRDAAAAGRVISRWNPTTLGVHQAIGGGPLPGYVHRPHDDLLYAVLDPDVAANRLVVLRGGSSTGKTRAAYQAVYVRLPHRPVFYPRTAAALAHLIGRGVPRRSVLWLNELRHYADDPAGATVLFQLIDLVEGRDHIVAITSLWPSFWNTYTAGHHGGPGAADTARGARELLTPLPELTGSDSRRIQPGLGGVIDVPDAFTRTQLAEISRHGDSFLRQALTAAERAGQPGRIAQHLAGVPDLLAHYERPGADPYGKALITAAMDAVRLGHAQYLRRELLQDAALGYLTPEHRAVEGVDVSARQEAAWMYATRLLKGAVRALQPIPPQDGWGVAGYTLADSLDQFGRRHRHDKIPPRAFWTALAAHAQRDNLKTLGDAAQARGLYRDAAYLLKRATACGNPHAAYALITLQQTVHPADYRPARWAATHAALDDSSAVRRLFYGLQEVGAHEQVIAFANRAIAEFSLDNFSAVGQLLSALSYVGAHAQLIVFANRAIAEIAPDNPAEVAWLLNSLHEVGAHEQIASLLDRDPAAHAPLDNPEEVAWLLNSLHEVGAHEQIASLLDRDPAAHAP